MPYQHIVSLLVRSGDVLKKGKLWGMFLPYLDKHNERRTQSMTLMLLALDEQMSRLFPKTSKLGGLLNHAHKPRKPAPLGIMLKNEAECESVMIVCDEVVQNLEQQSRKICSKDKISFLDESNILVHAVEV